MLRASDGSTGYFSVAYAKANRDETKLERFQGQEPLPRRRSHSTSGYNVPLFAMTQAGLDPQKFFGRS